MARHLLLLILLGTAHAAPPADPAALEAELLLIPWDPWSLLDHRLANRRLSSQLGDFRLFAGQDRWSVAADGLTGTQVPRPGVLPGAWHGHAFVDIFAQGRLTETLDFNVNFSAYNRTASAGYRNEVGILPGFTGEVHGEITTWDGEPLHGQLMGLDLGSVTLGKGLLFEHVDMEGGMGRLRWGELWARLVVGGQIHEYRDDLIVSSLGYGAWSLSHVLWPQHYFHSIPQYLSLAGEVPGLGEDFRLGLEAALRLPGAGGGVSGGGLLRADWMPPPLAGVRLHLGYQARWYEQGISPFGDTLYPAASKPAIVWREDTYYTNAFEAWWPSAYYRQWWHTGMFEGIAPLTDHLALRAEVEGIIQYFDDDQSPARRLAAAPAIYNLAHIPLLPAPQWRVFYRAGIEVYPAAGLPHRLRLWMVNKATDHWMDTNIPTATRFGHRKPLVAMELELFL